MDHTFHEYPLDQPYPREDDSDKLEPGELLEECWFFTNLLHTKPTMSRSLFDPPNSTTTTSSTYSCPEIFPGKSYEETYESIIQKIPAGNDKSRPSSSMEREDPGRRRNLIRETSSKNLFRVPSLPTILTSTTDDQFEEDDEEVEFSMGKLIRQASLNSSDTVPPRTVHAAAKGLTSSSSISSSSSSSSSSSRHQSRMKPPEMCSVKSVDELDNMRPQRLMRSKLKTQKSMSYLESEEVGKRSTNEDHMKARIKFWARAVASNVDQES